jgi:hypothetical protein
MKPILAVAVSLLMAAAPAWGQSASTGRADDNYGSNAAAGNNASNASTDQSANKAATAKKSRVDRKAANQPAPGNSAAETAGAATPNDTSRPEAAAKVVR